MPPLLGKEKFERMLATRDLIDIPWRYGTLSAQYPLKILKRLAGFSPNTLETGQE